ncbi:alpha/beta hydrolase [Pseudomonas sp. 7P_10.2_Bac1]|uniref:alpha/beta hydrolase n=1 Tax=Pseudomonas sp. 7P_10.2_Bac1 TaxID=2971614 RepID=UPI0021C9111D|nr:alpha/beta hydrolase [Pseudomonas sp. 7P_10.2_Bac1]MCU1728675.1 alpha/beta hydrolase [Pseudomonas sp. 7P_10.2_Bac1]
MSVLPELEAFLELAEFSRLTGKSQPMHTLTPAQARIEFEQSASVLDEPGVTVDSYGVRIPARDGFSLSGRLYRRPGLEVGPLPVVVYLHGGGYVIGSLDSHDSLCRRLAAAGDFAVLAVSYRLAPEWVFPTAVHDACDAVNWVLHAGNVHGLDATRVAFAGDSAGGTLSTVLSILAVREPQEVAIVPRAQVLLYPVTDGSCKRDSHQRYAEGYLLETATMDWFYRHYAQNEETLRDWRISPMLATDVSGLAPALVYLAGYDPLFDEGLAYAQKLEQAGNEVLLLKEPGMTHDFMRMSGLLEQVPRIHAQVAGWLNERLGE